MSLLTSIITLLLSIKHDYCSISFLFFSACSDVCYIRWTFSRKIGYSKTSVASIHLISTASYLSRIAWVLLINTMEQNASVHRVWNIKSNIYFNGELFSKTGKWKHISRQWEREKERKRGRYHSTTLLKCTRKRMSPLCNTLQQNSLLAIAHTRERKEEEKCGQLQMDKMRRMRVWSKHPIQQSCTTIRGHHTAQWLETIAFVCCGFWVSLCSFFAFESADDELNRFVSFGVYGVKCVIRRQCWMKRWERQWFPPVIINMCR